jgi:hypothetical protein
MSGGGEGEAVDNDNRGNQFGNIGEPGQDLYNTNNNNDNVSGNNDSNN